MTMLARVTDAVQFYQHKGEPRRAVRVVRTRVPERFRWRRAVGHLTHAAGRLLGSDRMRIEEPVREVVLDLGDVPLKRRVVLEARAVGVDLDRGEVLPLLRYTDLKRLAYATGTDPQRLQRHMPLPTDPLAPIDSGAAILLSSAVAQSHRARAQQLWNRLPGWDTVVPMSPHHKRIEQHADQNAVMAKRWDALAKALAIGAS